MNKQTIYQLLKEKMLSYTDYATIPVNPVDEPLLPIDTSTNLTARQIDETMFAYTGEQVFIRFSVLRRLK